MAAVRNSTYIILFTAFLTLSGFVNGYNTDVVNYLGTQEIISFNKLDYKLAWSSHPSDNYYKHEYVPVGDTVDHFHDMILIDFIEADVPLKDAVTLQVKNIIERKKTDRVCNYQLLKKPDEYMLDFVMSEGTGDLLSVVEWNAYHYNICTDKNGHKGVLLFGVSHRVYGDNIMPFMHALGPYRNNTLKALSTYIIPEILVK